PPGDGDGDQPQDLSRFLPGLEGGPFVCPDDQNGVLEPLVAKEIDGVGVVVRANLGPRQAPESKACELQPRLCAEVRRLVTWVGDDENEETIGPELVQRSLGKRQMPDMRGVAATADTGR